MYLSNLSLTNFRSFESLTIPFQSDLTVLVGENNGGKSNAIDAIRLLTHPIGGRRELYCEPTDVRFDSNGTEFCIEGQFLQLTDRQKGCFLSAVETSDLGSIRFGFDYDSKAKSAKPSVWAGRRGNAPEPFSRERIKHVYLPPLRDAIRSLGSGNPTRILSLLNHFLEGENEKDIVSQLARSSSHPLLGQINKAVNSSLRALTTGVRQQEAAVNFSAEETMSDIARDLRFRLGDFGIKPDDLIYSGHGYANLLFLSIIAVELEKVKDSELTIFLVEEPEAHLHPQLQAAVLTFLKEQSEKSRKVSGESCGPAGELQVVVATHSPNLSAWVPTEKLVVFKSCVSRKSELHVLPEVTMTVDDAGVNSVSPCLERRTTSCIPISQIKLTALERRKIDRYLDVTKSALLFGGRVLLLEGIAEALLLPVIASKHILVGREDDLRKFKSTAFIPIDGVDFLPYIKLLLSEVNGIRIADKVVVITDGDTLSATKDKDGNITSIPGPNRKAAITEFAESVNASNLISVFLNTYSLEPELEKCGNSDILKKAYLGIHRDSEHKWIEAISKADADDKAGSIQKLFKDTRKGDFAHLLAQSIESGEAFITPTYLKDAIEALVL